MNRRLLTAIVLTTMVVTLAGCSMIFGGISDEELDEDQEYDDLRERNATVAIDVEAGGIISSGEFRAVYDLEETEELELYRSSLYSDRALDIHSVRYWYPDNGTELTGSELEIDQGRSSTDVNVPDGNGTLAFSGSANRKSFTLPAFISGSHDVTAPEGHRTSFFLFGSVSPSGYDREVVDDQERLTWEDADSTLSLRYYQTRDLPIFGGIVLVAVTVGGTAFLWTRRQVQQLKRQREELGLDVEYDDDDDKGPPPGLK